MRNFYIKIIIVLFAISILGFGFQLKNMPNTTIGVYTVRDNSGYGDITVTENGIQIRGYDYNGNTLANNYFGVYQITRSREKNDAGRIIIVYTVGSGAEEITFTFSELHNNKYQKVEMRAFAAGGVSTIFTR
ncbi:hypothetical protein [Brachyspira pulli]|uniref:hypothetical protein n=1 Tax=Brachyspira pulli TaxID=310721 RepID=UPI003003ABEF